MRPTFILASLLAVVPVSLICLALNQCRHINQFVHSLYPLPPPLLNPLEGLTPALLLASNTPITTLIIIRDATGKHIHFASFSRSRPVTPDAGCVFLQTA